MKLWKTLVIAMSVAILPFALIGVGQAQQMTCWGLRPNLAERTEHTEQRSLQELEDTQNEQVTRVTMRKTQTTQKT